MGTAARGKFPALIQDLLENGPSYDFYQGIALMEVCQGATAPGPGGVQGAPRLRPAPEISFPAADIRRCRLDERGRIDFELNFMGLYGVDAPLPHFFLETVAEGDDPGQALRAFLDVFNQRLYQLLYLAWKKFQAYGPGKGNSLYDRYLTALAGIENPEIQRESLAYAGLLGSRVKNSEGLCGLLGDFLQMPVRIRQHVPSWVQLDDQPALGSEGADGLVLGENSLLGERVLDVSRKILITIGPVPMGEVRDLLPGGLRTAELGQLIRQYLDLTIDFDIDLQATQEPGPPARLGCQEVILGWTSGLGEMGETTNLIHLPGSCF